MNCSTLVLFPLNSSLIPTGQSSKRMTPLEHCIDIILFSPLSISSLDLTVAAVVY